MTELERYGEMLTRSLVGHLESPEIKVIEGDPYRYLGIIVSPTFEGMEDHDRQRLVWQRVYDTFDEQNRRWIEFLFTNTPSEMETDAVTDSTR